MAPNGVNHIQQPLTESPLMPSPIRAASHLGNCHTFPPGGNEQRAIFSPPTNGLLPSIHEQDADAQYAPTPVEFRVNSQRNMSLRGEAVGRTNEPSTSQAGIQPASQIQGVNGQYSDLPTLEFSGTRNQRVNQVPSRSKPNSTQPRSPLANEVDARATMTSPPAGASPLEDWQISLHNPTQRSAAARYFKQRSQTTMPALADAATTIGRDRTLAEVGQNISQIRGSRTTHLQKEMKRQEETLQREGARQPDLRRSMARDDSENHVREQYREETHPEIEAAQPLRAGPTPTIPAASQATDLPPRKSNQNWFTRSLSRAGRGFRGFTKRYGSKKPRDKTNTELVVEKHRGYLNTFSQTSAFNDFASHADLQLLLAYEKSQREAAEAAAAKKQPRP